MLNSEDAKRSLTAFDQNGTLVVVIELSQSSWLVAGIVPGVERHPVKKLEPDQEALLRLLRRWQDEAAKAGRTITRIAVAYEAGRDGFWLARWLRARGVEAYVIHPTSIAVSREHRRAKTGSTRNCSSVPSSVGCAASRGTAAWPRSRHLRRKTPNGQAANVRLWSASAPEWPTA
jgi:hypothetical protein